MALKSTIYKATIQIADMDRAYYAEHNLTIAQHPSENDRRMMLRLLAFCVHADEQLSLSKGLSNDEEPDLWQKELNGTISHWIDLGQLDEKRIKKACGLAERVTLYPYTDRRVGVWWEQIKNKLMRFENLSVITLDDAALESIEALARRSMQIQCTIQDSEVWLTSNSDSAHIVLQHLKRAS